MLDVDEQASITELQVKITPNPMKNQAQLVINGMKTGDEAVFTLYNLVGKEVYRTQAGANTILNRNNLPAGLYIYTLSVGKQVVKGKIILE
jgi:uncharacterized protein YhfF